MIRFFEENNIAEEKTLSCSFSERMDTANCLKIEEELFNRVCEAKMPIVFDLGEVDYISSAFLRLCLRVVKEVGTDNFSIANVHSNVKKVFMIAGFDKELKIT